jgi:uncharacterized lipoprotein YajG
MRRVRARGLQLCALAAIIILAGCSTAPTRTITIPQPDYQYSK